MLVRFVSTTKPEGIHPQDFAFTIGGQHVVLGVHFAIKSSLHGTGTWLHLLNDDGQLGWAPLSMFAIADARVSQLWRVRRHDDGTVSLYPELFHREFFHDDLSEGVPEVVQAFAILRETLEREAFGPATTAAPPDSEGL